MENNKSLLVIERKPTSSGSQKYVGTLLNDFAVSGEVYPANLLELTIANVFWILLLLLPMALVYIFLRRGLRILSQVNILLGLIPTATTVST